MSCEYCWKSELLKNDGEILALERSVGVLVWDGTFGGTESQD